MIMASIGVGVAAIGALVLWVIFKRRIPEQVEVEAPQLPAHDTLPILQDRITKVVLENGLTVLVCKQGTAPKVLVQIAYDVGSAIEQEGERGLAHLLEHMIFKGTEKMEEGDIDAIARKYGADFNAFTSHDMTSYYFEADANNWQHFVPILADCMQNARFDDQHLASEVKAVIQELRMYRDSHWHVMVDHAFTTLFPANHPYHHPIIGYKEDLADISGKRLKAFYDKYYHPSRAVLCIVGDVDPEEAIQQARDAFEGIECKAKDQQPPFIPLTHPLRTYTTTLYQDVQHEQVGLYWRIPGLDSGNHAVVSAVEYVLGGGISSRLYSHLVDELQIASSVRVGAEQLAVSGIFLITIEVKKGQREQCIQAVVSQLDQIVQDGCEEIELYKMVKNRQRQHMLALHHLNNFTYHWLESYFSTRDELSFFKDANTYAAITPAQVKRFCAQWLNTRDMHRVILTSLSEASREVWQQEQAKIEEYYQFLLDHHKRTDPLAEPKLVDTLPAPKPLTFNFPQPTRVARNLSNDLVVVTYTEKSLPIVSAVLMFKQAAYFARAKEGVGIDIMMALLLEGSQGMSKEAVLSHFDLHGAQYGYSGRGMSLTCSRAVFGEVFDHAMHVLTKPKFSQASFDKIRDIFIHSYEQKKDSAQQVAMRRLKQSIYHKHPYGWSFDDMIEYIRSLTIQDIEKLHARYVCSSQMVLSVSGDIEPAYAEQVAIESSAQWQQGSYSPPVYPARQEAPQQNIAIPMLRDQVVVAYGRPSSVPMHDPKHIMLDLLSYICFHSLGSKLFTLRERTGLFYTAAGGWGIDIHQEDGFDYLYAIVSPENLSFADEAIMKLLEEIAQEGVTKQELNAARQLYTKEMIDATTDVRTLAGLFANIETMGIGYDYYDKALRVVHDMSAEQISKLASDYVNTDRFVRVSVGRGSEDTAASPSEVE